MSKKHNKNLHISHRGMAQIPKESSMPNPSPVNCKHPCPYGAGRPFCFPCYYNIVKDERERRSRNGI